MSKVCGRDAGRHSLGISVFIFMLLSICNLQVFAQQPGSSGIKGHIKDTTGAVIPGATVTLTDSDGKSFKTQAQPDGSYTVHASSGTWTVTAESQGLTQQRAEVVTIGADQTVQLDITMAPEEMKQVVNVTSETSNQVSVDPSSNADSLVIKGADLEALPDDPDDLQQDLQALAGPSAGPNGGEIYVDGFSSGRLPPKASIREIRINQNPFSSEYDKLGFGRIEIFTKPGSDHFHGAAFYDTSSGIWNARNPFILSSPFPSFLAQTYGGNLSGPVNKHASFFFDFERRQIDDNAILNAITLDPVTLAAANQHGFTPTPQQRTTISPRIDWQLSSNNTLSLRYSYLDLHRDLSGVGLYSLPGTGFTYNQAQNLIQLTDTAVLSPSLINETRYQFHHDVTNEAALSSSPQITVPSAFVSGGSTIGNTNLAENSHEVQNISTYTHGSHTFKFGARVRSGSLNEYTPSNFNGTFTFGSFAAYQITAQGLSQGLTIPQIQALGGGPSSFTINAGNPAVSATTVDAGVFIQDDWRLRPNLTLSAGLRWEGQTNIHDWADFAPRISFAWAPRGSSGSRTPKTVIRGGFGMFYVRYPNQDELYAQQYNGINQQSYLVRDPSFYPVIPSLSSLSLATDPAVRFITANNFQAPYLLQSAIGIERQIARKTTLAVNFTDTRGVHQFVTRDINALLRTGLRPYGDVGDIFQYESSGMFKQMQLITRINTQIGSHISLFGAYIWNNAHSNTDGSLCASPEGCGTSTPVNQYDLSQEWGRSSLDIEHRMFLGGSIMAPGRIQLSPFITASSGVPFNITTGSDYLDNGILNGRPAFAAGPGTGIIATPYGYLNPFPTAGETLIPRNLGTGPGQFTLNLRVSHTWGFGSTKFDGKSGGARASSGSGGQGGGGRGGFGMGRGDSSSTEHRYNLTLSISARNMLNHVNYSAPVGVIGSPFFLQSTSIAGGYGAEATSTDNRRIDIQLRFQF